MYTTCTEVAEERRVNLGKNGRRGEVSSSPYRGSVGRAGAQRLGVGDTSQEDKETRAVTHGQKIRGVTAEAKSGLV